MKHLFVQLPVLENMAESPCKMLVVFVFSLSGVFGGLFVDDFAGVIVAFGAFDLLGGLRLLD